MTRPRALYITVKFAKNLEVTKVERPGLAGPSRVS